MGCLLLVLALLAIAVYIWRRCASTSGFGTSVDARMQSYGRGGRAVMTTRGSGLSAVAAVGISAPVALEDYTSRPASGPVASSSQAGIVPRASLYI